MHGVPTTTFLSAADLLVRLGVAAVCGALLGIDREVRQKTLGLRTHMLVSLGAASFTIMVVEMVHRFRGDHLQLDPTRIVEGVIGGIGFLGAGAIIQQRGELRGATTGAGIWMVGAIGMAAGFGFYLHAAVMTGFAVLVITVLGLLTHWLQADASPGRDRKPSRPSVLGGRTPPARQRRAPGPQVERTVARVCSALPQQVEQGQRHDLRRPVQVG